MPIARDLRIRKGEHRPPIDPPVSAPAPVRLLVENHEDPLIVPTHPEHGDGTGGDGGVINNNSGALTLTAAVVSDESAGGPGGEPSVVALGGSQVMAEDLTGAKASPVANLFETGNATDRERAVRTSPVRPCVVPWSQRTAHRVRVVPVDGITW